MSLHARHLLVALLCLANFRTRCVVTTLGELAEWSGAGKNTIAPALKDLRMAGLVSVVRPFGQGKVGEVKILAWDKLIVGGAPDQAFSQYGENGSSEGDSIHDQDFSSFGESDGHPDQDFSPNRENRHLDGCSDGPGRGAPAPDQDFSPNGENCGDQDFSLTFPSDFPDRGERTAKTRPCKAIKAFKGQTAQAKVKNFSWSGGGVGERDSGLRQTLNLNFLRRGSPRSAADSRVGTGETRPT